MRQKYYTKVQIKYQSFRSHFEQGIHDGTVTTNCSITSDKLDKTQWKTSEICLHCPSTQTSPFWCVTWSGFQAWHFIMPWLSFFAISVKKIFVITMFISLHQAKIAPKLEKPTGCNQNSISSEDAHNAATCHISGHSFHTFYRKLMQLPNLTHLTSQYCC